MYRMFLCARHFKYVITFNPYNILCGYYRLLLHFTDEDLKLREVKEVKQGFRLI